MPLCHTVSPPPHSIATCARQPASGGLLSTNRIVLPSQLASQPTSTARTSHCSRASCTAARQHSLVLSLLPATGPLTPSLRAESLLRAGAGETDGLTALYIGEQWLHHGYVLV